MSVLAWCEDSAQRALNAHLPATRFLRNREAECVDGAQRARGVSTVLNAHLRPPVSFGTGWPNAWTLIRKILRILLNYVLGWCEYSAHSQNP